MLGKVTVWYMTEEERLAYIEKHPVKKTDKPRGAGAFGFDGVDHEKTTQRRIEALKKARTAKDYKWRGKKAAEQRWRDK